MSLCGAQKDSANCEKFLSITNGSDTLTALHHIAVQPYLNTQELFALFTTAFPYPEGKERRATEFSALSQLRCQTILPSWCGCLEAAHTRQDA